MRRKKRKKFKKVKFKVNPKLIWIIILFILGLFLLSGLGYGIYMSPVFRVEEDTIKSNVPISKQLREKIAGQSLFTLDIKSISRGIQKKHPEYKRVYMKKRFPSYLIIEVKKRDSKEIKLMDIKEVIKYINLTMKMFL